MRRLLLAGGALLAGLLLAVFGCLTQATFVDESGARKVLAAEGWTNVRVTGARTTACSSGDFYATAFEGMLNGRWLRGTVCRGRWTTDSTVRVQVPR